MATQFDILTLRPISTFGILGAGTLGWRIGLQAALSGYRVLMYDIAEQQLLQAQQQQATLAEKLVRAGRYTSTSCIEALAHIETTTDANDFAERVDFVSESVTEDLALKRDLWAAFAGKWQPHTVLTTNTSYLLPSAMADVVGDAARFCAFHFHDVFEARVVDVMPHPGTAPEVVQSLLKLGVQLKQIPVEIKAETPGYLFNHMLMAFLGAAGQLLSKDKASVEDIDRSWMGNMGTRIGPFGMLDQIGLDTVDKILSAREDAKSKAFRQVLQPLLAAGHLGSKSGKGFYTYPQPAYAKAGFLEGVSAAEEPARHA